MAQVQEVVELVRGVLGADTVAIYLYGSAVLGGLQRSSDLDIFVVSRRPSTAADKRALIDGLMPMSGSHATAGPARSIELTIVVEADVRPWRFPPPLDFLYGDWLRSEFARGEIPTGPRPNPDLAILITILLLITRPGRLHEARRVRRWTWQGFTFVFVVIIAVAAPALALWFGTTLHKEVQLHSSWPWIETSTPIELIGRILQLTLIAVASFTGTLVRATNWDMSTMETSGDPLAAISGTSGIDTIYIKRNVSQSRKAGTR
jgi:predicted nucleotidyltransferase